MPKPLRLLYSALNLFIVIFCVAKVCDLSEGKYIVYEGGKLIPLNRLFWSNMDDPRVVASLVITKARDFEWVIYLAYSRTLHG